MTPRTLIVIPILWALPFACPSAPPVADEATAEPVWNPCALPCPTPITDTPPEEQSPPPATGEAHL